MDRIGKFAVALAIVTLFAWTYFNQKDMEKAAAARKAAAVAEEQKKAAEAPAVPAATTATAVPDAPAQSAPPAVEEKQETLANPAMELTFSNLGGGIARAVLLKHTAEQGKNVIINEFGTIPIGAVSELPGDTAVAPFSITRDALAGAITFQRTDARQVELTKRFATAQAGEDEFSLHLDVTFTNKGTQPITLPGYFVYTGAAAPVHQKDLPIYTGLKAAKGKFVDVNWFSAGGIPGFGHPERPVYTENRTDLAWLGVTNQYFTTLISPQSKDPAGATTAHHGSSVWAKRFDISDSAWKESGRSAEGAVANSVRHGIQAALGMPGFTLAPGESATQNFLLYTGPREYSRLKKLGDSEEEVMDFGMFGFVSKTLLNGLNWLHARFNSYAAAIIVLTLIIKSLLWPMQNKATQSMKRMQLLTPKQTEIREKYKDDPTRMNMEIMKLYKDYGANPLSGCLPMLIQIPIFFGFYNMLGKAVELRNSHFLWVNDLSQPDTVAHLAGVPINILPLIMAGTMFWQMSISPKSGDPMQQRMFMFMPLIFVFFCYNYASALALYWAVQNLFSVAQLYATRNQAPPQLVKVSASKKK
jgi:YidC/Oxa1 family membrane protein insertase